jgi:hypothetical protein
MAALDDWAVIDRLYPKRGQCEICGEPGVDQRHRVLDAIAERSLSESVKWLAADFGVSVELVEAVGRSWIVGEMS